MTDALKPCPFCGGAAAMIWRGVHVVECQNCWASVSAENETELLSSWNRRAPVPVPDKVLSACNILMGIMDSPVDSLEEEIAEHTMRVVERVIWAYSGPEGLKELEGGE